MQDGMTKSLRWPEFRSVSTTLFILLMTTASLRGQSEAARPVHVHGIVRAFADSTGSRAQIRFDGDVYSKTLAVREGDSYDVDLPGGLYTLTVQPRGSRQQEFRRPLFRAASGTSLALNAVIDPSGPTCDKLNPPEGQTLSTDSDVIFCGGVDLFPVPSEDKVPFQVLIRYQTRRRTDQGHVYSSDKVPRGLEVPVFVAYNLFTLRANAVVYDEPRETLKATGKVVVERPDGTTQRAESMTIKIANGEGTPLPKSAFSLSHSTQRH
jgi:hypothetical protein